ncbi:glycerate kinase, partial [Escherichia coli]|uniref:glycerate kinase n=1 Tax=Escherichia coli TaxID=562 RepID=UPI001485337E
LQQQTEINVCQMAGGGAAGGRGIAAAVFLKEEINPGIESVLNAVNPGPAVQGADRGVAGEGGTDTATGGWKRAAGGGRRGRVECGRGMVAVARGGGGGGGGG